MKSEKEIINGLTKLELVDRVRFCLQKVKKFSHSNEIWHKFNECYYYNQIEIDPKEPAIGTIRILPPNPYYPFGQLMADWSCFRLDNGKVDFNIYWDKVEKIDAKFRWLFDHLTDDTLDRLFEPEVVNFPFWLFNDCCFYRCRRDCWAVVWGFYEFCSGCGQTNRYFDEKVVGWPQDRNEYRRTECDQGHPEWRGKVLTDKSIKYCPLCGILLCDD